MPKTKINEIWREEEDKILKDAIIKYGEKWPFIAYFLKTKTSKQCKDRWLHLKSKNDQWTAKEDQTLEDILFAMPFQYETAAQILNKHNQVCAERHKYLHKSAHKRKCPLNTNLKKNFWK